MTRFLPVTVSGAALACLDLPPAPDVATAPVTVYLGGLGSSSVVAFTPVATHPALIGTTRQLLVDLLGSGWSDHDDTFSHTVEAHAEAVATLLDSLALDRVRLVGHSLGGSIAIVIAATRPDLVGGLVTAEPNLDPGVGTFSREITAMTEGEFVEDGHARIVTGLLRAAAEGDVNAAQFARTVRRWSSAGLHRTAISLLADRTPTFRDSLAGVSAPRTYLSGALSAEDLEPVRAIGCDVRVVPDAGHVLMTDNLGGFVQALTAD